MYHVSEDVRLSFPELLLSFEEHYKLVARGSCGSVQDFRNGEVRHSLKPRVRDKKSSNKEALLVIT